MISQHEKETETLNWKQISLTILEKLFLLSAWKKISRWLISKLAAY